MSSGDLISWSGGSCAQWLARSIQEKTQWVLNYYAAYGRILNDAAAQPMITQADQYCGARTGAGDADPNQSDAKTYELLGTLFRSGADAAARIAASFNQLELAKINADVTKYVADLRARYGQTADPAEQANLRNQEMALLTLQAQLQAQQNQSPGMNTTMVILLVLLAAAILGGVYVFSQRNKSLETRAR
jgi:hypothetical protein